MVSKAYINQEASQTIKSSGGTATITPTSLSAGAGRVAVQLDLGASPRAQDFEFHCQAKWAASPVLGETLDLYLASAPDGTATDIDGDVGATDAALGDTDALNTLKWIGSVYVDNADATKMKTSGNFQHSARYLTLVIYNASAAAALSTTATDFLFEFKPSPYEGQ